MNRTWTPDRALTWLGNAGIELELLDARPTLTRARVRPDRAAGDSTEPSDGQVTAYYEPSGLLRLLAARIWQDRNGVRNRARVTTTGGQTRGTVRQAEGRGGSADPQDEPAAPAEPGGPGAVAHR